MKKEYLSPDVFYFSVFADDILTVSVLGLAGEIGEEFDGIGYFE